MLVYAGSSCGMVSSEETQEEPPLQQTLEHTAAEADLPTQCPTRVAGAVEQRRPRSLAKACLACRIKKTRCDTARPRCSACVSQGRECIYKREIPRKRYVCACDFTRPINAPSIPQLRLIAHVDMSSGPPSLKSANCNGDKPT